jgi:NADPH:quinone reductase-like Zn-dependent oxidoreductase
MSALPTTMHGVWLLGHGGYEQLSFREDLPVPVPSDDEVLIQVGAAGVNNTDINTRIGWYSKEVSSPTTADAAAQGLALTAAATGWSGDRPRFPRIQGADACGRIVAVGAHVDVARIGERVLVEPVFTSERAGASMRYFGSECDGGFAEYAIAPARHAHRRSDAGLCADGPCVAASGAVRGRDCVDAETALIIPVSNRWSSRSPRSHPACAS